MLHVLTTCWKFEIPIVLQINIVGSIRMFPLEVHLSKDENRMAGNVHYAINIFSGTILPVPREVQRS